MLNGAGIFTYMTGCYIWGSHVAKDSSTMEHMGLVTKLIKDYSR